MELTQTADSQNKVVATINTLAKNKIVQGTVVVAAVAGLALLSSKLKNRSTETTN